MTKDSKWTEEMLEKLKDLYLKKDISTVEIANILGFSKNAIIGKIHRMKLNEEKQLINAGSLDSINRGKVKTNTKVKDNTEEIFDPKNYTKGEYPLESLDYNMCAWPFGEDNFTFCGEQVVYGKPYCQEHLNLVYLQHKKSTKKKDNLYVEELGEEIDIIEEELAEIDEV